MRWNSGIVWALFLATVGMSSATIAFTRGRDFFAAVILAVWIVVLAAVGGILASRRPHNPIGWLMVGAATFVSLGSFADSYASYSLDLEIATLPLDMFFAWVAAWATVPGFGMLLFVMLLFPTGSFRSRRWSWAAWFVAGVFSLQTVLLAIRPGPIDVVPSVDNPLGLTGAGDAIRFLTEGPGGSLLTGASLIVVLARVVALVGGLRRTSGVERQQTKWFVYSVVACVGIIGASQILFALDTGEEGLLNGIVFLSIMAGLMFIPVAIGLSVLRYRLYDIDRIINRTIVYALVTGSLVAVYAGTVFATGTVTAGTDDNLTVAAATLIAAAAFRPLLRRVQSLVDQRFYRHKYDAQRTIDAFGSRLREETNLDELTEDLVGVVRTTMQPAHVSVWLSHAEVEP
jgi:hypothetical protein